MSFRRNVGLIIIAALSFFSIAFGQVTETKLTASDRSDLDNFGAGVSMNGDFAIIGAPYDNASGDFSGSAYVFKREGVNWIETDKLIASDGASLDGFGSNISMFGDYVAISASGDDNGEGAVYIFTLNSNTWSEQAKIVAGDGVAGDAFGYSISLSEDRLIVGAPGNFFSTSSPGYTYIFTRDGNNWTEEVKLLASDAAPNLNFGFSVGLSDSFAIVGSTQRDANTLRSGSAYIFKRINEMWVEQVKFTSIDGVHFDEFAWSVAIDGDYALVGAMDAIVNSWTTGSGYIFKKDSLSWALQATLTASDVEPGDQFASSLFLTGDYAILGTTDHAPNNFASGAAYLFQRFGSNWTQQSKLFPGDGSSSDDFGVSLQVFGEYVIVGASGKENKGAAYIYKGFVGESTTFILTPAFLSFGTVNLGQSAADQIIVTNTDSSTISIDNIVLSGQNSNNFSLDTGPFAVLPGEHYFLDIVFIPDSLGERNAILTVESAGKPATIELQGSGIPALPGSLSVTPGSLSFGDVTIGQSELQTVTFKNTGSGVLNIGPINISGPNADAFAMDLNPTMLQPDESEAREVTFTPTTTGNFSASIVVDSDGGSANIPLSGNGIPLPGIIIADIQPAASQILYWGESIEYVIHVQDQNGLPVAGAIVGGENEVLNLSYQTEETNSQGITNYQFTIPAGLMEGGYSVSFTASKAGYTNSPTLTREVAVLQPTFVLNDYLQNPIASKTFEIYKINDDLSETFIASATTNEFGRIPYESDWLMDGDQVKFTRLVHTENSVKRESPQNLIFQIHVDNAGFDNAGDIYYHTFSNDNEQGVSLGHAHIKFNLLVSVEWDASAEYLDNLLQGFRYASNLIYDVSNGQLYIDNVHIFDNREHWDIADIRIFANNSQRIENTELPGTSANMGKRSGGGWLRPTSFVQFSRIPYSTDNVAQRVLTYNLYPYDWTLPTTHSTFSYLPAKALAHEFVHYSIGILDEYLDGNGHSVLPGFNFGLMDDRYGADPIDSELSGPAEYEDPNHQVTWHYLLRGENSAWEFFQWSFADTYDDIPLPIHIPQQTLITGPNDDLETPNVDVGQKLIDNSPAPVDFDGDAFVYDLIVRTMLIFPVPDAEVRLIKANSNQVVYQGKTSISGEIYALGANNGDLLRFTGSLPLIGYVFGEVTVDNSLANGLVSEAGSDSNIVNLGVIQGDIRIVSELTFSDLNQVNYQINFNRERSEAPSLEVFNNNVPAATFNFSQTANVNRYSTDIDIDLGRAGLFTLFAKDDSLNTFFINQNYVVHHSMPENLLLSAVNYDSRCTLTLDSLNSPVHRIMILSSAFHPVYNGITADAEYAGNTHTIAAYPNTNSLLGSNALSIRFEDNDLMNLPETQLKMFWWNPLSTEWELIGGTVDTLQNTVSASISAYGTYGLFTADPVALDNETPPNQTNGYALNPNYPNPFNPTTTISFQIAKTSHVELIVYSLLGQKVKTLISKQMQSGDYLTTWNGRDELDYPVASGLYILRIMADDFSSTRKILLIR